MLPDERRNQKFKELIEFIGDTCIFTKQIYPIAWSVEKTQKYKI